MSALVAPSFSAHEVLDWSVRAPCSAADRVVASALESRAPARGTRLAVVGLVGSHDNVFRKLMKEEGAADALLRERLPGALVSRFVGPPEQLSESFVDEALRGSLADVVLRVKLRGGDAAYVYCLVEHKRTSDRWMLLQVLRYVTALYAQLAKISRRRPLPAVIPLVIYNGRRRWRGPLRFSELVDLPKALRRLTVDFEVLLVDLGAESIHALSAHRALRGGLLALKAAATPPQRLEPVLNKMLASLEGESTLRPFLQYLAEVGDTDVLLTIERVRREYESKEKTVTTIADYYMQKGRRQGVAKGVAKGIAKGIAKGRAEATEPLREAVRLLLTSRFKRLPARALQQLADADLSQLERWVIALNQRKSLKATLELS